MKLIAEAVIFMFTDNCCQRIHAAIPNGFMFAFQGIAVNRMPIFIFEPSIVMRIRCF